MYTFLVLRCGHTWDQAHDTTLPQFRLLQEWFTEHDSTSDLKDFIHRVMVGKPLYKTRPVERSPRPARPAGPGESDGVLLGPLYDAVKARMKAEGWTEPAK